MILTNHGKHLSDAFVYMRERFSEITVFTSKGGQISLNQNLLNLFSPFLREVLGSIPQDCAPVLIIPEFSSLTLDQFSKILTGGVTSACNKSYKDVSDMVELGKLFGLDLSRISYEQKVLKKISNSDFSETSAQKAVQPLETLEEAVTAEDFESKQHVPSIVVKEEPPEDNLLSFCEGIKGLIGKSLGIESNSAGKSTSPFKIKQEIIPEEDDIPEVFSVNSEEEPHNSAYFQNHHQSSDQLHEKPVNEVYQPIQMPMQMPMQMPIQMPMSLSMHSYPNTFMETPPPEMFQGFHQNMVPTHHSLPHHQSQPAGTISNPQEEYQSSMMKFHNSRMVESEQQQPPRKKMKQAFTCDRCKVYETPHAEHFKRHFSDCKRLNPKGIKLDCRICEFSSTNPVKFHSHIREEHLEMVTACEHCDYTTFSKRTIKKHMMQYHNWASAEKPVSQFQPAPSISKTPDGAVFSCIKCEYVGPHEPALRQHMFVKHEKQMPGKSFARTLHDSNHISSQRRAKGWGPDDRYTCDYWNFHNCKNENGHKASATKVARYHVCSLCFRNTGEKVAHPATRCRFFPLPEKENKVISGLTGERQARLTPTNTTRVPSRDGNRTNTREDGEVD